MSVKQETTALAVRGNHSIDAVRVTEWQRLWLSLQARPWTVLAIVPASGGAPPQFTVKVALKLARTGMVHLAAPIHVADGTDVPLGQVMPFLDDIARCRQLGDRILVALAPLSENATSETIAQTAECALLCVMFEDMNAFEAKRTVDKIGKERFLGSCIFRPEQLEGP